MTKACALQGALVVSCAYSVRAREIDNHEQQSQQHERHAMPVLRTHRSICRNQRHSQHCTTFVSVTSVDPTIQAVCLMIPSAAGTVGLCVMCVVRLTERVAFNTGKSQAISSRRRFIMLTVSCKNNRRTATITAKCADLHSQHCACQNFAVQRFIYTLHHRRLGLQPLQKY